MLTGCNCNEFINTLLTYVSCYFKPSSHDQNLFRQNWSLFRPISKEWKISFCQNVLQINWIEILIDTCKIQQILCVKIHFSVVVSHFDVWREMKKSFKRGLWQTLFCVLKYQTLDKNLKATHPTKIPLSVA